MACHRPYMAFPKSHYIHVQATHWHQLLWFQELLCLLVLPNRVQDSSFHYYLLFLSQSCSLHSPQNSLGCSKNLTLDIRWSKKAPLARGLKPWNVWQFYMKLYRLSQAITFSFWHFKFTLFYPGKLFSLKFNFSTANPQSIIQRKRETFHLIKL